MYDDKLYNWTIVVLLCCPELTCIFRVTPSNWVCSKRIRCDIRNGGVVPSLLHGNEPLATSGLPNTKCIWTAAWSVFNARRPCHMTGCRWSSISNESPGCGTGISSSGVDDGCILRPAWAGIAGTTLPECGIFAWAVDMIKSVWAQKLYYFSYIVCIWARKCHEQLTCNRYISFLFPLTLFSLFPLLPLNSLLAWFALSLALN